VAGLAPVPGAAALLLASQRRGLPMGRSLTQQVRIPAPRLTAPPANITLITTPCITTMPASKIAHARPPPTPTPPPSP
jgi:hypothetical protein